MSHLLSLHPVWNQTLTTTEKEKFYHFHQMLPTVRNKLGVTPYFIKYKIDSGIVATVFLQNGYQKSFKLKNADVLILNGVDKTIAMDNFKPLLTIPAMSTMPWSFIFSADMILSHEKVKDDWSVLIS